MIKIIEKETMGKSNLGWLQSQFHFSFAEYRNPNNINFGVLRVLNDDIIQPNSGFNFHPHDNMEIISYVIDGQITHKDSMGNEETLSRGEVQYLSAGNGLYHSEHNLHKENFLRLLQIWILPPKRNLPKLYGSHRFKEIDRKNKLLNIVSSKNGTASIKIHQDVNFYVSELSKNKKLLFKTNLNKQIYFVQIEGISEINSNIIEERNAAEINEIKELNITAITNSHFLFIEMNAK